MLCIDQYMTCHAYQHNWSWYWACAEQYSAIPILHLTKVVTSIQSLMKLLSVQCLTDSSTLPLPTILPKLALLAGWLPMWVCDCTDVHSVQCTHRSGVDTNYRNWSGLQSGNVKTGCLHRVEWIWRGFPVAMLLRYLISLGCKVYHNKSVHIAMFVCATGYLCCYDICLSLLH